jgi:phosphatidylglycerol:prolipoprotein diacylglycerol transferase
MRLVLEPYNLILFVAVHVGVLLTERRLRRDGESLIARPWVVLAILLGALAGGRLHFLIEGIVRGTIQPGALPGLLSPLRGGSTFFGAMAGMLLTMLALRRHLPYGSILRFADAGVPGLGVAVAIGRIGCFVNGCCLGTPTRAPWGVGLERHAAEPDVAAALAAMGREAAVGLHPLVIYLALWSLVSAWLSTRRRLAGRLAGLPGTQILLFGALFSAGRFVIEAWRLPPAGSGHGLHPARWEALGLAVGLTLLLVARARRSVGPGDATLRRRSVTHE